MSDSYNIAQARKLTTTRYDVVIWCILATLLTSILRDVLFDYINWLFGGLLLVSLTLILIKRKSTLKVLIPVFGLFALHLIITSDISREIKDSMNWICALEFLMICVEDREIGKLQLCIIKSKKLIKYSLYLYLIELVVIMMLPSAYGSAWGSGRVFSAFNAVQGTAANCCLYVAIALYYIGVLSVNNNKKKGLFHNNWILLFGVLLNIYAIFLTQVRAVLFSVLATMVLFAMILFKNNIKRIASLAVMGVVGLIVLLNNSGFRAKMLYSKAQLNYSGFTKLDALLSSRPIIWQRLITHFFEDNSFIDHLLGAGFSRVYEINIIYGNGRNINAHSDIIHTLIGMGIIGLIVMMIYALKIVFNKKRPDKFSVMVLLLYIIIPLAINGIMMTPYHVYSIIFIILTLDYVNVERKRLI